MSRTGGGRPSLAAESRSHACTRGKEGRRVHPARKCDTRNLARPVVFVYEAIKSRQYGIEARFKSYFSRGSSVTLLLLINFPYLWKRFHCNTLSFPPPGFKAELETLRGTAKPWQIVAWRLRGGILMDLCSRRRFTLAKGERKGGGLAELPGAVFKTGTKENRSSAADSHRETSTIRSSSRFLAPEVVPKLRGIIPRNSIIRLSATSNRRLQTFDSFSTKRSLATRELVNSDGIRSRAKRH